MSYYAQNQNSSKHSNLHYASAAYGYEHALAYAYTSSQQAFIASNEPIAAGAYGDGIVYGDFDASLKAADVTKSALERNTSKLKTKDKSPPQQGSTFSAVKRVLLSALVSAAFLGFGSLAHAANGTGAYVDDSGRVIIKDIKLSRAPEDNLVFASTADPVGFDPAQVNEYNSSAMVSNIYEGLLRFKNGTTEIEPSLATSYTVSDDGLTYTFKLRHGVKFTDGTPFNAEAVKINYERQTPENRNNFMTYAPLVFQNVKSVDVVDDYTVRFTLEKATTPFISNMAMVFAGPVVSPKALKEIGNEGLMTNPVGTGPYMLYRWDRGQQVILTRNPNYWGGEASIENVIYRIIPEASSRIVALKNGEIDIANSIDPTLVKSIEDSGNKIFKVADTNTNYMIFNHRDGSKTKDYEVRLAVAKAINVDELTKSLYEDYATPAHSFLPKLINGYSEKTHGPAYDVEGAKKLFKKHNIKTLKILTYSSATPTNAAGGIPLAEAVQAFLKKAGVNAEISVSDLSTYRQRLRTEAFDLAFQGWITDNFDADNFFGFFAKADPVSNQGLWINKKFNALIEKGATMKPGKERDAVYQEADQVMMDDLGVLPLSHAVTLLGYRPNVSGSITQTGGSPRFYFIKKAAQ